MTQDSVLGLMENNHGQINKCRDDNIRKQKYINNVLFKGLKMVKQNIDR